MAKARNYGVASFSLLIALSAGIAIWGGQSAREDQVFSQRLSRVQLPLLANREPEWMSRYEDALAKAKKNDSAILIYIDGKGPEAERLARLYANNGTQSLLHVHAIFRLSKDDPHYDRLVKRYKLDDSPTVVAILADGREIARMDGKQGMPNMSTTLLAVVNGEIR